MSTALTVYQKVDSPIAFAQEFAEPVAALIGCDVRQGKAMALYALCEGLNPMELHRRYHWIMGKPTMQAAAMLAEFRLNWGGTYKIIERSANRAAIEFTDKYGEVFPVEWTWAEAQESRWPWDNWKSPKRVLKDNWATPTDRKAMLWVRLISDSLKAVCPELTAGIYTPEEIRDLDPDAIDGEFTKGPAATTAPTRMTAREAAEKAAAAQQPSSSQATGDVGTAGVAVAGGQEASREDVVDAEFEPAAAAPVVVEPPKPDAAGSITDGQHMEIEKLFTAVLMSPDGRAQTLQKRGVNSIRSLSKDQAKEIIDKLQAKIRNEGQSGN